MSAVGCFGRFTFSHLAFHIPTLAGSCLCLFCVVVCLVALFLCFWFLFCKCLGIPNSPRSLDLDDRQGLIARSAMQQKKSYLMTWLWIPHASSWSSTYECVGLLRTFHPLLTSRFTFQHLPTFVFCLFCVLVWFFCFCCVLVPVLQVSRNPEFSAQFRPR